MISTFIKLSRHKNLTLKSLSISTAIQSINQFPNNNYTSIENHPENSTYKIENLLQNCTNLHQLHQLHAHIIRINYLQSNNVAFYWNNLIRSYTRFNSPSYASKVFLIMLRNGVSPDNYTLPITIKAVGKVYNLRTCQEIHGFVIKIGLENDEFVESGLINVYVKAGEFRDVYKVFDESPERKLGSWNAIIAGLVQNGRSKDGLNMFRRMRRDGVEPDGVTMVSVLSACGGLGGLVLARQLHKYVYQVKVKGKEGVLMMNAVIDMYGKCGRMDLASRVFSKMDRRNVSSWTSMIVGYAKHGHAKEAMECFHGMVEANVVPNHVTFLGVLSACVHGGMVSEGKYWFVAMQNDYGIEPQLKHYGCMVDLLGRAGLLDEAREMVEAMPMKTNVVIWGCLLGACETHNDVKTGKWVAERFLELEPWNDGIYVVLSNIYANRGMWEEVENIRDVMKHRSSAKLQGYSSVTTLH